MNPGLGEETGKAVGGIIESLKQQPLSLALVIMNLALLGLLYYVAAASSITREREVKLIYDNMQHVTDLIARCIVPEK